VKRRRRQLHRVSVVVWSRPCALTALWVKAPKARSTRAMMISGDLRHHYPMRNSGSLHSLTVQEPFRGVENLTLSSVVMESLIPNWRTSPKSHGIQDFRNSSFQYIKHVSKGKDSCPAVLDKVISYEDTSVCFHVVASVLIVMLMLNNDCSQWRASCA
jgi:hypothetical protein